MIQRQILAALAEEPGCTVAEIASEIGPSAEHAIRSALAALLLRGLVARRAHTYQRRQRYAHWLTEAGYAEMRACVKTATAQEDNSNA